MAKVATSILTVKEETSIQTFYKLETAKTDYFHIDVMDGKFVEKDTRSLMKKYSMEIKHISNIPLDVHFMVEDIQAEIDDYLELNPDIITFHIEAAKEKTKEFVSYIKEQGIKVGLSIKPGTKIEEIYPYLPYIHMVLIMTVEPGKGGQKLIPETLEKIRLLKAYLQENNLEVEIEADGGINLETADSVKEAGVEILVSGSAIIDGGDIPGTIAMLKK